MNYEVNYKKKLRKEIYTNNNKTCQIKGEKKRWIICNH